MSLTFNLSGTESVLSTTYFPHIHLDPMKKYCLGLISFNTFYTIPNLVDKKFYYDIYELAIPNGYYDIKDLETFLKDKLGSDSISLKPNYHNTKCTIYSKIYNIDFTPNDSLFKELGYNQQKYYNSTIHHSEKTADLVNIKLMKIQCNITSGSYHNEKPTHLLHQFAPVVGRGVAINEHPRNINYLPVSVRTISNITLHICDQNGELINFQGEPIDILLELKQWA